MVWSWNTARQPPSVDGPLAKIERAHAHIKNLDADINRFLKKCGYRFRRHFKGDPPTLVVTVKEAKFPPVPDHFSLLAGEAIYQLRTSLDHLFYELVRANREKPSRRSGWPILAPPNKEHLEEKIKLVSATAKQRIKTFQPYLMGVRYKEHPLWRLKKLNDWDKHNFVIRAFIARHNGFRVEWTDSDGKIRRIGMDTDVELRPNQKFSFGPGLGIHPEMNVKIKTEPYIVFEKVGDTIAESALPSLGQLSDYVSHVVRSFSGELS
ncbi:MAG: hypothetical protein OXL36_00410 [Bryobacterales bacterium]|nr:hypothetical protein [Bryobacterales bacterium]MDE0294874.1 hypothetical protein [Bryobacterales bacterium]